MIIDIKNKDIADLPALARLILRLVYEPEKMRLYEINFMQRSLKKWAEKIKENKERAFLLALPSGLDKQEEYIFGCITKMLKKDSDGGFDERKRMFKEHGISWRKFHRLPGSYTVKELQDARKMKEEYDEKFPEFA